MTLDKLLIDFYKKNDIPLDGGVDNDTFRMSVFGITIILPNPKFRREAIHIHDIQHVLHNCDVSWKGEGFISGWEIATGIWKYFPLGVLSLWAMGYSLWIYPRSVCKGFKKGLQNIGVIDLKKTKEEFLKMEYADLVMLTAKKGKHHFGVLQILQFIFWSFVSQVIFLFPVILLVMCVLLFC